MEVILNDPIHWGPCQFCGTFDKPRVWLIFQTRIFFFNQGGKRRSIERGYFCTECGEGLAKLEQIKLAEQSVDGLQERIN